MIGSFEGSVVERHAETQPIPVVPQAGCRTLCQHPGCGQPIELEPPTFPGDDPFWAHIESWAGQYHPATPADGETTPAEQPEPAPGQQFVDSVQATVRAYQRGRDEALPRQALEQPSSLVDALLEAAGRNGVDVVQSPGTYRAAERVAGLLLDILRADGGDCR